MRWDLLMIFIQVSRWVVSTTTVPTILAATGLMRHRESKKLKAGSRSWGIGSVSLRCWLNLGIGLLLVRHSAATFVPAGSSKSGGRLAPIVQGQSESIRPACAPCQLQNEKAVAPMHVQGSVLCMATLVVPRSGSKLSKIWRRAWCQLAGTLHLLTELAEYLLLCPCRVWCCAWPHL